MSCLVEHRDALLAFHEFPAEHWKHPRTTDGIDKRLFPIVTLLPHVGDFVAKRGASPGGLIQALAWHFSITHLHGSN
jgi:hypothetical protein